MITSNLPFSNWESIFKDPMTTASAVDRLVHDSVTLELRVPSYQLEQAKAAQRGESKEGELPGQHEAATSSVDGETGARPRRKNRRSSGEM